jgi:hypothetical protein
MWGWGIISSPSLSNTKTTKYEDNEKENHDAKHCGAHLLSNEYVCTEK